MNCKELKQLTTADYNYLYHYGLKRLNDPALIEDLIQDTFLVVLEQYDRFEQRSSELTWMTAILKHKIYKVYRLRSKEKVMASDKQLKLIGYDSEMTADNDPYDDVDPIMMKEFYRCLGDYLSTQPDTWQQVYQMRFVLGWKAADICHKLSLTSGNYWVICHRLKLALKQWYVKNWQ
ncbi:sigma-70 family RNA polymerase sigma factor [Mucilaginibacter sp. PAMB04168]|uniref:sigma-70 family RNA polymerase sigma factor n=1 Tax=Mucilaginibacter sp. PAMB04168 TaxID=3138567 RepID=UPI0031F709AD